MISVLLLGFALLHLVLLVFSLRWPGPALWLVRGLLLGMAYDNVIQAIGPMVLTGADLAQAASAAPWYTQLSFGRYCLHAVLLPWLSLYAMVLLGSVMTPPQARNLLAWGWGLSMAGLAYGLWFDLLGLQLQAVAPLGHAKLAALHSGPPLATIAANLVVLGVGWLLWRRANWPWLLVGAAFIFVVNGASAGQPWGFVAGNFAELVFALCLLASWRRFKVAPARAAEL